MEELIQISKINDFGFSPESLYLHSIYESFYGQEYKDEVQIQGSLNHTTIDSGTYSTRSNILQGVSVYSETYGLVGKIDLYYGNLKLLVERKTRIKKVHQGYIYQLYAQFFCLREMNIPVEKLALRSLSTNQSYQIDLPTPAEENDFAVFIKRIRNFDPLSILTNPNPNDLAGTSIYSELKF